MKKIILLMVSIVFSSCFSAYAKEMEPSEKIIYNLVTPQYSKPNSQPDFTTKVEIVQEEIIPADPVAEVQNSQIHNNLNQETAPAEKIVYHLVTPQDSPPDFTTKVEIIQEEAVQEEIIPAAVVPADPVAEVQNLPIQNNENLAIKYYERPKNPNPNSGSYVSFDLLQYQSCYLVQDYVYGVPYSYPPQNCGSNYGFGFNYKYVLSQDRFFAAPSAFYEYNTSGAISGRYDVSLNNKYRYGLQIDLGYDVTDKFSPYVIGGYANIYYRARTRGDGLALDPSGPNGYENLTTARSGVAGSTFSGAGFKYNLNQCLSFKMEYLRQNYIAKGVAPAESVDYLSNPYFKVKLQIFKAGISYHF